MPTITNRRVLAKEGPDFYPTPSWGTKLLLVNENFNGTILEPCAGNGAMAEEIVMVYGRNNVVASDLYDRGYGTGGVDVFSITARTTNFVTNPPFNIASEILEHALDITDEKVCLLLRLAFVESKNRYERFYRTNPPTRVWVFSERLSMYPEGYPVKGGGTTCHAWFVWSKKEKQGSTELKWFPTGWKPKHG